MWLATEPTETVADLFTCRPGDALPRTAQISVSTSRLVQWCAAQENWHKIHYDAAFANEHYGGARVVVNGALKHNLLLSFLALQTPSRAWVQRLEYRCFESDAPDEVLLFTGRVEELSDAGSGGVSVAVTFTVENLTRRFISLAGRALIAGGVAGRPSEPPQTAALDLARMFDRCPRELEHAESEFPVDRSRVRLFCEATFNYDTIHFDTQAARAEGFPDIVAPPLLAPHALDTRPGSRPLGAHAHLDGREGTTEIGRDLPRLIGIDLDTPIVNGGSVLEVLSLPVIGDRIHGNSKLHSIRASRGRRTGPMVVCQTLNQYATSHRRILLTEMQTIILPMATLRSAEELVSAIPASGPVVAE